MNVLSLNWTFMRILGMCSDPAHYWRSIITNWILSMILLATIVISLEYTATNLGEPENILYGATQVASYIGLCGSYVSLALRKTAVLDFYVSLSVVVNKRKSDSFDRTERRAHLVAKLPLIGYCMSMGSILVASTVKVFNDVLHGNIRPRKWFLIYKMSIPFDRSSVPGFIYYYIFILATLATYMSVLTSSLGLFLGSCFYLETLCINFEKQFNEFDRKTQTNKNCFRAMADDLSEIVKFQVDIVSLFDKLAISVSGLIFSQLLCGAAFISLTVFQLDSGSGTFSFEICVLTFAASFSVVSVLPYCYYGARISRCLSHLGYTAYKSSWYELPSKLQLYVLLSIAYGQRPRFFKGYGMMNCSLEAFMKILNTSVSYYLMFKSFSRH